MRGLRWFGVLFAALVGAVLVFGPGAPSASAEEFQAFPKPVVASIAPSNGSTAGGTVVTITGYGFNGVFEVLFDGISVSPTAVGFGSITAVAPPHAAGTVDVRVNGPNGKSANTPADNFTYVSAPTVTSSSPHFGPAAGGTEVTIVGAGFAGASLVWFGGTSVTPTSWSATKVKAISPPGSGAVNIRVTATLGTSPITGAATFTYTGSPTVTSIDPEYGPTSGGTAIHIYGTNLNGATSVSFGYTTVAPSHVTATHLVVVSPPHSPGTVSLRVTTPAGTSPNTAADDFTYVSVPVVTSVEPDYGPSAGGTHVYIHGYGFTGTTHVLFGATHAYPYYVSDTLIKVISPAHAPGLVDVLVVVGYVTSVNNYHDNFTYTGGPWITSITPNYGPSSGGTYVTIYGGGFTGTSYVLFGATVVYPTFINDGHLKVVSPAGSPGTVDLRVVTPGGTSPNTVNDNFTYTGGPFITAIVPASGPTAGGTLVTIYGGGFTGTYHVTFGGIVVTPSFVTDTTITVVSPANTAGPVDIRVVTTAGTTANTVADDFLYVASGVVVVGLSPSSGPDTGGIVVTIVGAGFTGVVSVQFGTVAVTPISVTSTTIVVVAPAGSGTVDVRVFVAGGVSGPTVADDFTYVSSSTVRLTLAFRWSLIVWSGRDGINVDDALRGRETPDNPATVDIINSVSVIFLWDGVNQRWLAYFPGSTVPGVNDFATMRRGVAYWIAVRPAGGLVWVAAG